MNNTISAVSSCLNKFTVKVSALNFSIKITYFFYNNYVMKKNSSTLNTIYY